MDNFIVQYFLRIFIKKYLFVRISINLPDKRKRFLINCNCQSRTANYYGQISRYFYNTATDRRRVGSLIRECHATFVT